MIEFLEMFTIALLLNMIAIEINQEYNKKSYIIGLIVGNILCAISMFWRFGTW